MRAAKQGEVIDRVLVRLHYLNYQERNRQMGEKQWLGDEVIAAKETMKGTDMRVGPFWTSISYGGGAIEKKMIHERRDGRGTLTRSRVSQRMPRRTSKQTSRFQLWSKARCLSMKAVCAAGHG